MTRAFHLFGLSHLVALMVTALLIIFGLHWLQTLNDQRYERRVRFWLAFLIVLQLVGYRLIFLMQGSFQLGYDLPLHLCGLSEILIIIYLLRPEQRLFDLLYYFVFAGAALGPLIPDLQEDFPAVRYFAMFVPHALMVFILLYLLIVRRQRPSPRSYLQAFKMLNLWALCVAPFNYYLAGNYLFLRQPPEVNFGPVRWLPAWPWYLVVLEGFFLLLYRICYQPFATAPAPALVREEK